MGADTMWLYDAGIGVRADGGEAVTKELFRSVMGALRRHGFKVEKDPRIEKDYKSLSRRHRQISKHTPHGTLYVSAEYYPAGLRLEGWQTVVFDNPNGGRYDFNKLAKMPYQIRLTWLKVLRIVQRVLVCNGAETKPQKPKWEDDPLGAFNAAWTSTRFKRGDDGWPAESELKSWRQIDADGIPLRQGDYRYVIGHNCRWWRVRVYGGINGMWIGVSGAGITNCNASSYHSCVDAKRLRRRDVKESTVQQRLKNKIVEAINAGQFRKAESLTRELKARGVNFQVAAKA